MVDTLESVKDSLLYSCFDSCTEYSCFASCVDVSIGSRLQRAGMAGIVDRAKKSLTISCLASFSSILGALLVIFISHPSIYVSRPWRYGILKSFLAGALTIAATIDTGSSFNESWASVLGGSITAGFASAATITDPPSGHEDPTLTAEDWHELQKREYDSPRARGRALVGGILTAVVIGLRNVVYGVWFFSMTNESGRYMLQFSRTSLHFFVPQFVTLGAAVAVPLYRFFGPKCWWRTLLAVAVSSAAFPLGYNLAALVLPSEQVVLKLHEFQTGMMMALTLMYLVPSACQNALWRHCMVAVIVGIVFMAGVRFGIL